MKSIATLTMNPTIDAAYEVDDVLPVHKLRSHGEYYAPGGGGINVARVFVRLGGNARCVYLSGGATGAALDGLIDLHQLVRTHVPIGGHTRISTTVLETRTGKEFRIVPPGPTVTEAEWTMCLDALDTIECDYLVASGSLPPGVPDDFYARAAERLRGRGIRMVLDSSSKGLSGGLAAGGVYLVKPSLSELSGLSGTDLRDDAAIADAALALVRDGRAENVAVTLGRDGALLANAAGSLRLPAIAVEARSTVGAGDSFLAAMVHALSCDEPIAEAFRLGLAAGAAAVLSPGTGLAHPQDIRRLHEQMNRRDQSGTFS